MRRRAGWSGSQRAGWPTGLVEQLGPGRCHGQARGRCMMRRRAVVAIRAGRLISWRRMVPVVALPSAVSVRVAAARVRLNAITARASQAALAVNRPLGRCASAEFFRSAWTCSMTA